MKLLCDAMLARLGRWLRAAGYDTVIAEGAHSDRALLERARREDRLLLTRDRKLLEFKGAAARVVLLPGNDLETAVEATTARLAIDWLHRPFSRCLVCNRPLEPASATVRDRLPPAMRATTTDIRHCHGCDRLYWPGGHVRRMRARLESWAGGPGPELRSPDS